MQKRFFGLNLLKDIFEKKNFFITVFGLKMHTTFLEKVLPQKLGDNFLIYNKINLQ